MIDHLADALGWLFTGWWPEGRMGHRVLFVAVVVLIASAIAFAVLRGLS